MVFQTLISTINSDWCSGNILRLGRRVTSSTLVSENKQLKQNTIKEKHMSLINSMFNLGETVAKKTISATIDTAEELIHLPSRAINLAESTLEEIDEAINRNNNNEKKRKK